MRDFISGILTLVCLELAFVGTRLHPEQSTENKCSMGQCLTYGGPNQRYSLPVRVPNDNVPSGAWIVGEIRAFAFGTDNAMLVQSLGRNGWVECAGQQIDSQEFPEAVAILEGTWGSQNTSKTQIYLPDLRGLVLRGWQHGRQAPEKYPFSPYTGDTDLVSRVFPRPELLDLPMPGLAGPTDINTKQLIKDHVGSMQAEQFHGHRHSFSFVGANGSMQVHKDETSPGVSSGEPVRIGSSTGFVGGNETHPPNVYVLYLIYLGRPAYDPPRSNEERKLASPRKVQLLKD